MGFCACSQGGRACWNGADDRATQYCSAIARRCLSTGSGSTPKLPTRLSVNWSCERAMPTRTTIIERRNAAVEQIPRNCICGWAWKKGQWTRTVAADGCPWHLSRRPKP